MSKLRLRMLCSAVLAAALILPIGVGVLAAEAEQSNVNLDLKDTDVKSAIEALFRGTGKNYSIDSNVSGVVSALSIKDVPFDTALRSLTKSAGLVYRQDGGVYLISAKPNAADVAAAPMPIADIPAVDATTDEPEIKIEKIPLNNLSASEILSMLNGADSNRTYGGYGMGSWGMNNYGTSGRYGSGYGSYGSGYGSYGSGYGSYGSGYGSYGSGYNRYGSSYGSNYNSYGNRSYGYGTSTYGNYRGW